MADDLPSESDRFVLAGEYVLGVLEGEELSQARRMQLADRDFAQAVEWWEWRLGTIGEAAGTIEPSEGVWPAIAARLGDRDVSASPTEIAPRATGPSRASLITFAAGAALSIAGLVLFLSAPEPAPIPQPTASESPALPSGLLIAQFQNEESGRRLAGIVDPQARRIRLDIAGLEAETGRTAELWVIPEGGTPVSLGFLPGSGRIERGVSAEEAQLLGQNATLAVTFEEDGGIRHEAPTLPIVLSGSVSSV
ncbi:hypothetical protein E3U23_02425 [Erythrobacter litoralis]|uniref:anti-sigma factor n=1 Tax=Erythrobacter litoralis TaxID=39960 RepID=UPI00243511B3|nr:anti-sigma factor [Erythrobacter litoralis]MDG6078052.1 hypothetical protein [Erythrobacter litoralis]